MDNINLNILSTTRLLTSYSDRQKIIRNLILINQELKNRLFGKGEYDETL